MSLEVKGIVVEKYPIDNSTKYPFGKVVLKIETTIGESIKTSFAEFHISSKKGLEHYDKIKVGAVAEVKFNLYGYSYTSKKDGSTVYQNKLDAWYIKCEGGSATGSAMQPNTEFENPQVAGNKEDDLPF